MEQQFKQAQIEHADYRKPLRADLITNKQMLLALTKIILFLSALCLLSWLLPMAQQIQSFSPSKWEKTDELNVRQVSPLNRKIKFYLMPDSPDDPMDAVMEAQAFSMRDEEERELRLDVKLHRLEGYEVMEDGDKKYYLGDIHVLDEVAYRFKILKPKKLGSRLLDEESPVQQEASQAPGPSDPSNTSPTGNLQRESSPEKVTDAIQDPSDKKREEPSLIGEKVESQGDLPQPTPNDNIKGNETEPAANSNESSIINSTDEKNNSVSQENKTLTEEEVKEIEEQRRQAEEQRIKAEEQARKAEEQARQAEQARRIEEEEQARKAEEAEKKLQQIAEQRRKEMEKTNIRIEAYLMTDFSTILELVVKYISILVIIYMAADNSRTPVGIPIVCALFSNPLLFMQVSFPNDVSNVIDSFCSSAPLLYPCLWMYYIHHKIKYDDEKDGPFFLTVKLTPCLLLYFLEVLRLMHFDVVVWETVMAAVVWGLLSWYLWEAFLNIKHQHHRDKMLVSATLTFIAANAVLSRLAYSWSFLMSYIVIQTYGMFLLYLLGRKTSSKKIKVKKTVTLSSENLEVNRINTHSPTAD